MTPDEKTLAELQMDLNETRRVRDEYLDQRNRYAQIMCTLAEYIRRKRLFPEEAMEQVDRARGLIKYKWPE